jgi:ABC-type oligopeptide transport system substrate-binding subunit
MKKKLFACVVLAVLVAGSIAGCCTSTNSSGVSSKSFANCVGLVENYACNPPAAVTQIINQALPLVVSVLNVAVPGSAAFVNATNAQAEMQALIQGGCISVTTLDDLVAYLSTITAAPAPASLKLAGVVKLNIQPVKDWDNTFHCFLNKKF